jgi:MFS family permease
VTSPASTSRFSYAWRALRHRNFRLFLSGQSVSLIGSWMSRLALAWLTYRLTHSALLLGLVAFAGQILTFLLAPFAGVWIDRIDRRKLLIATQAASALQSGALAWLTLAGVITLNEIFALAALQGVFDAFDMPARQSFLIKMVGEKADLPNAIALNSSAVNVARLVGPPAAALIIARLNEGYCFLIDAVSYLAVILSLWLIRTAADAPARAGKPTMLAQMADGWAYVSTFLPIRNVLLLFAVSSFFGMSYMPLTPLFATQVLHDGPHTLGLLSGAAGVGALASALMLAARKNATGMVGNIQIASVLFGAGLILLGGSHFLWLSLVAMLIVGFGMMQGLAASNTLVQTLSHEEKRGRVMSFYTMAFVGTMPFGSLFGGALAHYLGVQWTVILTGSCLLIGALAFSLQRARVESAVHDRYDELGLLAQ